MSKRIDDPLQAVLRECRGGMAFAGFASVVLNVLALIVPLYMIQIYDRVITSRSLDTLTMLTIITVLGLATFSLFDYLRARIYLIMSERVVRRMDEQVLTAAVSEALRSRGASAQALRDLDTLRTFISQGPISTLFDAFSAPIFLLALFLLHPSYGIVALIALVALAGLGLIAEFIGRRPGQSANESALKVQIEAGAVVRSAELVEGLGMLPAIARRWRRQRHAVQDMAWRSLNGVKVMASITKGVRLGIQVAVLALGAVLVLDHAVSPGALSAASIIIGRKLLPFEQLIDGWRQWASAAEAKRRLHDLFATSAGRGKSMPMEAASSKLVVDRLSFIPAGSDKAVLRGISFEVEAGEAIGVVGPSASGKSTLARLLVGAFAPTGGGVYLDGQPVHLWERASFGAQVGYLPQSVLLLDGTIRENIARFDDADPADIVAAARKADVHEMIGRMPFGYETQIGEGGFQLSGGQRQRIGLARALFGKPKLLILDEPNAALDAQGEMALVNAIRAAKAQGTTVVLIAHRPSLVAAVDKLLVLNEGSVERYGPRAEIMRAITVGANKAPPAPVPAASPGPATVTPLTGATPTPAPNLAALREKAVVS